MKIRLLLCAALVPAIFGVVRGDTPKIRKNIDDLSDTEFNNYVHAFEILRDRPSSELESLSTFIRLHNGGALPNGKQGGCVHASTDFLPWHRILLHQFELALQKTDPPVTANVTLPFWDFSKEPSGKRFPKVFEDQTGPLWHDNRFNLLPSTPPAWVNFSNELEEHRRDVIMESETLKELYELDRWRTGSDVAGFSNSMESSPHNWMHTPYSMGDMGVDTTAARDPLFWSYHCYIDLMWFKWQVQHTAFPGADPDLLPGDLTKVYDAFPTPAAVGSVLDPSQLGYTYSLPATPQSVPQMIVKGTKLETVDDDKFQLKWSKPVRAESVDAPRTKGASVTVAGLKHTGEGSWQIEFFLHPVNVKPNFYDKEFVKKYFVANHVQWKGKHRHSHHDHTHVVLRLKRRLVQESLASDSEYRLSVRYKALPTSVEEALAPGLESKGAVPLEYKSISVSFD